MRFISCDACAGTGEAFIGGMSGDGWQNRNCPFCEGHGKLIEVNGKSYPLSPNGTAYRAKNGRYTKFPHIGGDNNATMQSLSARNPLHQNNKRASDARGQQARYGDHFFGQDDQGLDTALGELPRW